ncbi:[NiFe]-hydrogenase assembly chaperone HybE [Halomonas sp. TRM85114]|uniref:[NiFe]-hydrogenase assembly chaperone HybE n=1 Tax=Halomonas jincaotanensis TaxID=2810616 RepID=UPI001BD3699B|nr:[NiFe]-hydrogenase assembly chaperone HybE [Halomonas jincaotanensis]MBS9402632.1 [NiFe]-hydrogenase assembly chaperone HybE [Halomonas jincaotanensis]
MQSLSPEQYGRLRQFADAWTRRHLKSAKRDPHFNPRLGVDALCFQPVDNQLLGALITPLSLSLAMLPQDSAALVPDNGATRHVALPSGGYDFVAERLEVGIWWWRCQVLDDLSDIESLQQASRLAQQLMERVMTPDDG